MAESIPSGYHLHDLARLEEELAAASAQLEEYQRLIDEMPGIYEVKFSSQLHDVAQDIRLLMQERHGLQQQLRHCLEGQAVSPELVVSSHSMSLWRLSAFMAGAQRTLVRLKLWQLSVVAASSTLALALLVYLAVQAFKGHSPPVAQPVSSQPRSISPGSAPGTPQPSVPQLRLRARGEVWLEMRSLNHTLVLESTLQPGQIISIPLGDGLRIRSGRPHLLDVAQPDQPFAPLAAANDFSWRTFASTGPRSSVTVKSDRPGQPS